MKKNVLIQIQDKHRTQEDSSSSELLTTGTLDWDVQGYSLLYTETDEELQECRTTLQMQSDNRLVMTREGAFRTKMVLEPDRRHDMFYETPYGTMRMGLFTKDIQSRIGSNGGTLRFRYTLDYDAGFFSTNELIVTVSEQKDAALAQSSAPDNPGLA